jgi:16S rRNA (uracil1498-N3)-methyltransferase
MRRRFFVQRFEGGGAALRGEAAHHLARVLRAKPGQLYELSDGQAVWLARTERVGREVVEFALVEPVPAREPRLHATLLLAIVKFDRMEWALEKATELGATEIIPLAAARSDKALIAAATKRATRWQKILLEAAQQAHRLRPSVLRAAARPSQAFREVQAMPKILLSERPDALSLRSVLAQLASAAGRSFGSDMKRPAKSGALAPESSPDLALRVALAIGPEGGWTDEELAAAREAGFVEASLGANILRTETAVVAALAALNYALSQD